jgi:NADPH:quinone reductase-like Zn-dependent oxidoreductase
VDFDNIEGGYAEYVSMPKASVSKPVNFPPSFGWADFGSIPETFVTCMQTIPQPPPIQG